MKPIDVGAYFFPLTTKDPEVRRRANEMGRNVVDETLLAQQAESLFDGHEQPVTYCLGEESWTQWDDSQEPDMDAQIQLAHDAGLSFFVFDSYIGIKGGTPTTELQGPVDVFKKVVDSRMHFARMQTLASPRVILPVSGSEPNRMYDISTGSAHYIVDTCVVHDWMHPNHLLIQGRPYMSLFLPNMTSGWDEQRHSMGDLVYEVRDYANKQYKIDPYLVGVVRNVDEAQEFRSMGAEALTGYAFLPEFGQGGEAIQYYDELLLRRKRDWESIRQVMNFVPPAVVGWDASPRGKSSFQIDDKQPDCAPIVVGNSPGNFEDMLASSLEFIEREVPVDEQYGIICSWNEVTEGAALLPRITPEDAIDRGYLDAARRVINEFGR